MTRLALLTVTLCFCTTARVLGAQPPRARVVVVAADDFRSLANRLTGELTTRGFDVTSDAPPADLDPTHLSATVKDASAVAAIYVKRTGGSIQIWVMDRITHKTVMREIVASEGEDDGLLARRAVEVLRASLLELQFVEPKQEVPVAVRRLATPPRAASPDLSAPRGYALGLGGGAWWSPGGLGAGPLIDLRFDVRPTARWTMGVRARLPLLPRELDVPEGRVDWWSVAAGGAAAFHPSADRGSWDPWIGLGLSALWLRARGTATAPYSNATDATWVMMAGGEAGIAYKLSSSVRAYASANAEVAIPVVQVEVAKRTAATWGRPTISGALGVVFPL